MKNFLSVLLAVFFLLPLCAQQPRQILIETKNSALLLSVANNKRVNQSYLGKKLSPAEYASMSGGREVYLTAGMENQFEPAIRMVRGDDA